MSFEISRTITGRPSGWPVFYWRNWIGDLGAVQFSWLGKVRSTRVRSKQVRSIFSISCIMPSATAQDNGEYSNLE
jgi:hypothetical protein